MADRHMFVMIHPNVEWLRPYFDRLLAGMTYKLQLNAHKAPPEADYDVIELIQLMKKEITELEGALDTSNYNSENAELEIADICNFALLILSAIIKERRRAKLARKSASTRPEVDDTAYHSPTNGGRA